MRAQFSQSIDFNQMLVFSVFGHLVILTIVLFLPKPLQEVKVVVPAFIVSLVETSSGNKLAAQKKPSGIGKPSLEKPIRKQENPLRQKRLQRNKLQRNKLQRNKLLKKNHHLNQTKF